MRRLPDPHGWVLFLAPGEASRLIVFVHGFGGGPVKSWKDFPQNDDPWWRDSDLLFAAYDSIRDTIVGTATRLRQALPRFYPRLPAHLLTVGGASSRPLPQTPYDELVMVGHSLGGVIVRRALCDVAVDWQATPGHNLSHALPDLLKADVRLFSPASAGFRPAGWLGLLRETFIWPAAHAYLRQSSAYTDLQQGSQILDSTRRWTETAVRAEPHRLGALQPAIAWAEPDNVVLNDRYDTDPVDYMIYGTTHTKVCKPHQHFREPWQFVQNGVI